MKILYAEYVKVYVGGEGRRGTGFVSEQKVPHFVRWHTSPNFLVSLMSYNGSKIDDQSDCTYHFFMKSSYSNPSPVQEVSKFSGETFGKNNV